MEAPPQHSVGSPAAPAVTRDDRSTDRKNKVQRIGGQTRGLFEDFTSWIELRMRLFQLDVQERIQKKVDEAILKAAPVVTGVLAGLFALVTAALFVGWALGHPAWGFLVVTGLLLLITAILHARARRISSRNREVDVTPPDTNGKHAARGGSR